MRRLIGLLILLIAIFQINPAQATNSAGGSCQKLNATTLISGNQYTCLKSGNKLMWVASSKGVTTNSTGVKDCSGQIRTGSANKNRVSEEIAKFTFDAGMPCSYKYTVKDQQNKIISTVEVPRHSQGVINIELTGLTCDSIQFISLTAYSKSSGAGKSVSFQPMELPWCGWTFTGPNPTPSPTPDSTCDGALRWAI